MIEGQLDQKNYDDLVAVRAGVKRIFSIAYNRQIEVQTGIVHDIDRCKPGVAYNFSDLSACRAVDAWGARMKANASAGDEWMAKVQQGLSECAARALERGRPHGAPRACSRRPALRPLSCSTRSELSSL